MEEGRQPNVVRTPRGENESKTGIGSSEREDFPSTPCVPFGDRVSLSGETKEFAASDAFCNRMKNMTSKDDIDAILSAQKEALSKFEKTNEKLSDFNGLSAIRYDVLSQRFRNHTRMLLDMKKDLNIVFRRIRTLKSKLSKQYEHAFIATSENIQKLEESIDDEKPQAPDNDATDLPQKNATQTPQGSERELSAPEYTGITLEDGTERERVEQHSAVSAETSAVNLTDNTTSKVISRSLDDMKRDTAEQDITVDTQSQSSVNLTGDTNMMASSSVNVIGDTVVTVSSSEQSSERRPILRPTLSSSDDSDIESDDSSSNSDEFAIAAKNIAQMQ